jgi:hypothetical protein
MSEVCDYRFYVFGIVFSFFVLIEGEKKEKEERKRNRTGDGEMAKKMTI